MMAAIDLTQLRKQITDLEGSFQNPQAFVKAYHEILGFYHRYSHRPTKGALPKSFMRTYDLPPQILPQIEQGLKKSVQDDPQATMRLIEFLWQDNYFEARDLAAFLLGKLPASYAETVAKIIRDWLASPLDRAVVESIFSKATPTMQAQTPEAWEVLITQLLETPDQKLQNYGLQGLTMSIQKQNLADLAVLFKLLRPFIQSAPDALQVNLGKTIAALADRTPFETAYLLKQVLADTPGKAIERQMRSYLPFFPEESAASLSAAIKIHSEMER